MSIKKRNVAAMPIDIEQLYAEDLNITASAVLGQVVDLKGYGFGKGTVVMDVVTVDTDASETYDIVHELSDDAAFTSPGCRRYDPGCGRYQSATQSSSRSTTKIGATMYRYSRLRAVLAGTAPDLTGTYFLSESINPDRG